MPNIKIRKILLLGFQAIILITAVAGIIGLVGLGSLWTNEAELVITATNRVLAKDLERNLAQQQAYFNAGVAAAGDAGAVEAYIGQLLELDRQFQTDISFLEENILKPESKAYAGAIQQVYGEEYTPKLEELVSALQTGDEAATRQLHTEFEEAAGVVQQMCAELSSQGTAHMEHVVHSDKAVAVVSITMMSIITILAVTSSIFLGGFLFQAEQESTI